MLRLTDSIEQTTDALEQATPGAFRYGEADLRRAVERALYVRLSDRRDLIEAFGAWTSGDPQAETALESAVIGRLLERGRPARRSRAVALQRTARQVRWRLAPRARADRRGQAGTGASDTTAEAPVALVLDHSKFVSYLEPVLRELGTPAPVVISMAPGVESPSTPVPVRQIAAHGARSMPRPDMRRAGRGLAESWYMCSNFELLDAVISRERPRAVIVVEGNSPFDELANRVCRLRRIPCLCIQQGWSPIVHTGFRHMSFSAMLVWGQGFAELLEPSNPEQRFEVTGSPVFEAQASGGGSEELRRLTAGRACLAVFLQGDSPLISPRDGAALLAIATEAAGRLPEACVLIREHPGHPLDSEQREALASLPNVELAPPGRYPIRDVLDLCAVALSIYSTTLLESAARGRLPIAFNPTSLPRSLPDLDALGAGIELRDARRTTEMVIRLMQDDGARAAFDPAMNAFADRFFDGARPGAARQIRAAIDSASTA
jgi:hypothetical protein